MKKVIDTIDVYPDKTKQEHYIDDENLRLFRSSYYSDEKILNTMVKYLQNKELAIMSQSNNRFITRGWRVSNNHSWDGIDWFKRIIKYRDVLTHDYNLYVSCADYKYIPNFTYKLSQRSAETNDWFKSKAPFLTIGYDVFFDFDRKPGITSEDLEQDLVRLEEFLKGFKIYRYDVYKSGRGRHLVIKNNVLDREQVRDFVYLIRLYLRLDSLCKIGIGSQTKLRKLPYSVVGASKKIVLPVGQDGNVFNYDTQTNYALVELYDNLVENRGVIENGEI